MTDVNTHSIRITDEAKYALDLLAASRRQSKQEAASEAILEAWRKYQEEEKRLEKEN